MPHNPDKVNRRSFLKAFGLAGMAFPLFGRAAEAYKKADHKHQLLYVGTYTTDTASKGIYIFRLETSTGKLTQQTTVNGVTDPSFLTIDKRRRYLYAVNETDEYNGMKSGAVSAFSIDGRSGDLTFLNKQPSMGGSPCYISISSNNRFVIVANYAGGNIAVLPVEASGQLQPAIEVKKHEGTGPIKDRQEAAHAHWVDFDRTGRIVAACDLGADKIFLYRFDDRTGKLMPNAAQPFFQTKSGAGPRHLTFSPNAKFAYLINELGSTIAALAYDQNRGMLSAIQSISTLPSNWIGENTCAEIQLSPDGNFLYCSNRGHDSIVSYSVDQSTGKLSLIEHTSTGGKVPRSFVVDPTGSMLLAANQKSDNIVSFVIDKKTGKLQPTGNEYTVPSPVCLKITPAF
ncbi:MAG TPA: lactonase family protein [Pyrinomonadaceae bacterium]|nr:lactonase family protein [Pyrinomonadaceae bacterium]